MRYLCKKLTAFRECNHYICRISLERLFLYPKQIQTNFFIKFSYFQTTVRFVFFVSTYKRFRSQVSQAASLLSASHIGINTGTSLHKHICEINLPPSLVWKPAITTRVRCRAAFAVHSSSWGSSMCA